MKAVPNVGGTGPTPASQLLTRGTPPVGQPAYIAEGDPAGTIVPTPTHAGAANATFNGDLAKANLARAQQGPYQRDSSLRDSAQPLSPRVAPPGLRYPGPATPPQGPRSSGVMPAATPGCKARGAPPTAFTGEASTGSQPALALAADEDLKRAVFSLVREAIEKVKESAGVTGSGD